MLMSPSVPLMYGLSVFTVLYNLILPPSSEDQINKPDDTDQPDASVALKQLKYTHPWYSTYKSGAVGRPMTDAIQAVILGRKSVDEAVTEAQKKANKLLAPYNKARSYTQE